jgi:hypothetical protein
MIGSFLVWVKAKKTIHRLMFEQVTTWECGKFCCCEFRAAFKQRFPDLVRQR